MIREILLAAFRRFARLGNSSTTGHSPAVDEPSLQGNADVNEMIKSNAINMPPDLNGLVATYGALANGHDEFLRSDGAVREHWRPVAEFVQRLGHGRCNLLSERIQRRIVENGLTLDSFSDPTNAVQPWKLDLIPLLLNQSDWQLLERAAIQRAVLLESLLADLYGNQQVIADGTLPATLIHSDPAYLRPLHGTAAPVPRLTFLALDVARDHAGQWRILDTHAETIAGHGFCLANRVVLADVESKLFRACNARRISQFHQNLSQEFAIRAGVDEPTIAILGPNPDDETYLSHAYMARYLGYPLLEGLDLRVVGNKVFLKTLAGLQPVDMLLRAVEAAKCDPLELDPDGFAGPAGLVQAVKHSPSIIANGLGTAIVENRALAPYMAQLAKQLLGEDLIIEDSQRHWLGDPSVREAVFADQSRFVIRDAFEAPARPGHAHHGRRISSLTAAEHDDLIAELNANGTSYVAEEPNSFATAPSWTPKGLAPKPYAVRIFAAACSGEYVVMPGGLALNVDEHDTVALTSSQSESRDVWVLSDEPQGPHYSKWRISETDAQVQSFGARLPSRLADNLFWLGRYVERADWTMRVMRNALTRGDEDLRPIRRADSAESALDIILKKDVSQSEDGPAEQQQSIEQRVEELLLSSARSYSVRTTFQNIRRLARQTRNRLSVDAWRLLSGLNVMPDGQQIDTGDDLRECLNDHLANVAAFTGMTHENMTRNFGWRFLDIGRRIERALQMSELLRTLLTAQLDESEETDRLVFLLETADSFMTYRARYRFAPTFPLVLDLLMVDEKNPRSLAFQLVSIADQIAELPKASDDAVRTPEQRIVLDLLTTVRLSDPAELRSASGNGMRDNLDLLLKKLITGLPELSDTLSHRYFSLTHDDKPQRLHTRLAH